MADIRLKNGEMLYLDSGARVSSVALETFYSIAYPERAAALSRNRAWLYRSRAALRIDAPLAAFSDSGRIAGHAGLLPVTVSWSDRRIQGAWFIDYFVLPEYRGSGLGRILMQEVMQSAPLVLAVGATPMSTPVFERLGWRRIPETFFFGLPLRAGRFLHAKNRLMYGPIALAGTALARLVTLRARSARNELGVTPLSAGPLSQWGIEHGSQLGGARPIRDDEFLRWRILEYPFGGKFTLHVGAEAAALVRTYTHGNYRRSNILALGGEQPGSALRSIVWWALDAEVDYVALVCSDARIVREARRWFPFRKKMPVWVYSQEANLVSTLAGCPQAWEYIDSDLDLGRVDAHCAWQFGQGSA